MSQSASPKIIDPMIQHFPSPLDDKRHRPIPLLEQAMMSVSASIRRKPDWRNKRLNPEIVSKWRNEAAASNPLLTNEALDYVMHELDYYAELDESTGIEMSTVDGVYQSDSLLSASIKSQLNQSIDTLFGHLTDDDKDWHPGSNHQVWDLVHPSLYCAVSGRTHIVSDPISLDKALDQQGAGEPIAKTDFKQRVIQAIGAPQAQSTPTENASGWPLPPLIQNNVTDRELSEGEIRLRIPCWAHGDTVPNWGSQWSRWLFTMFGVPDITLGELKQEIARQWPAQLGGKGFVLLRRIYADSRRIEFASIDDHKTLPEVGIHSFGSGELAILANEGNDLFGDQEYHQVQIEVIDRHKNVISLHLVDESDQLLVLQQQLCDANGYKVHWPTITRGAQPADQQLKLGDKVLHSHRTFAQYRMRKPSKDQIRHFKLSGQMHAYSIEFARVGSSHQQTIQPCVEAYVKVLASKRRAEIIEIFTGTTVGQFKQQCINKRIVPDRSGGPAQRTITEDMLKVYYPVSETSAAPLADDVTFFSLGIQSFDMIGLRWPRDELMFEDSDKHLSAWMIEPSDATMVDRPGINEEHDADDSFHLCIRMSDRDVLQLLVSPHWTVAELKDRIRLGQTDVFNDSQAADRYKAVPVIEQRLMTLLRARTVLRDHHKLTFYGLDRLASSDYDHLLWTRISQAEGLADASSSSIQVAFNVCYSPEKHPCGERIVKDFDPQATVSQLIHAAKSSVQKPPERVRPRLEQSPAHLDRSLDTLDQAGIVDGQVIIIDLANTSIKVSMLTDSGVQKFEFFAFDFTPILDIQQAVAARANGIAVDQQAFVAVIWDEVLPTFVSISPTDTSASLGLTPSGPRQLHVLVYRCPVEQSDQRGARETEWISLRSRFADSGDLVLDQVRLDHPFYVLRWLLKELKSSADTAVIRRAASNEQLSDNHILISLLGLKDGEELIIGNAAEQQSHIPAAVADPFVDSYTLSSDYAWLPSDIFIGRDGSASIRSYINNIHPVQQQIMYPVIEHVFTRFVPMFEKVLTYLRHPRKERFPVGGCWKDDDDRSVEVEQPFVIPYEPPAPPASTVSLRGRTVQVITKLANIVLTPDNPTYEGSWHVEGMRNESIVASGIAYYDQCNIGSSSLGFRTVVDTPNYDADRIYHLDVEDIFGLIQDEPLVQALGHVDTSNGRCIAFPNIHQHRVAPFSLLDPSKPGYRSILVFFLVDPTINVLSTSSVPPQQRDWYIPALNHCLSDVLPGVRVLQDLVTSYVDWPMTDKEAKQHRECLMKERKVFVRKHNEEVYDIPCSLCEH